MQTTVDIWVGMKVSRKIPLRVIIGLILAVVLDTTLQLFWKAAVLALPSDDSKPS